MAKYYITTPIYYASGKPHIGHAYTTVLADVLARYHTLLGDKVFFQVGTDEHGAKVATSAKKVGKTPEVFVNEITPIFSDLWQKLDIQYDRFIRTTESAHIKAVQKALQALYDKGDIYKDKYEGWYCEGCEQFKLENDLVDGKCPDHQTKPTFMSEDTYMFRMSKYASPLRDAIVSNSLQITPENRKQEVLQFLTRGLKDISISRQNQKWGIPLPWDEEHTFYVWPDAFLNYLTVLGWNGDPAVIPSSYPPDLQLMAKDILRVHATIWPTLLLALGLPLPKKFYVHGYFTSEGKKMSKAVGNVIDPQEVISTFGPEATRYLLLSSMPYGEDGDLTMEKMKAKYTADLVNGLGNILSRTLTLCHKYFSGLVPTGPDSPQDWSAKWRVYDEAMVKADSLTVLNSVIEAIKSLDQNLQENKPWEVLGAQNNSESAAAVLYRVLEALRHIAIMLKPVMPSTSDKIMTALGLGPVEHITEADKQWGGLKPGTKLGEKVHLFERKF